MIRLCRGGRRGGVGLFRRLLGFWMEIFSFLREGGRRRN